MLAGGYLLAIGPLRQRFSGSHQVSPGQMARFLAGVLVILVALLSPLHELGDDYLFSAHMVQHLLLTLVVPPLLLLGTPPWLLRPLLGSARNMRVARFVTTPVVAFIIFNAVFVLWHVPELYDFALRERGIHVLEHLMFLVAGVIMWWPILSPMSELPRAPYPIQMIYLFLQPTVPSILGAIITFSDSVLYQWYADAPRLWDISALDDQQVGGIIMWVPGGLAFLSVLVVIFLVWASQEESYEQHETIDSHS